MSERATAAPQALERLLRPRTVAVVGVSERPSFTSAILRNLVRFRGAAGLHAVNPRHASLHGITCVPSVRDLPEPPDLVIVGVASRLVAEVLADCALQGAGGVQVISGGFGETGPDGQRRQAALAEWSERTGIPLAGPNCLGLLHARSGLLAMNAPLERLVVGRAGIVTQSGAVGPMIASLLFGRDIGVSGVITAGNEAALDLTDYLAYLVADSETEVIACFVEQIRRPERFAEVCRAAADRGKPIVMLKIGRSDIARRAALTHTGSLTGADAAVAALLAKHGVARVDSMDELVETIAALHQRRLPRGDGVATVHASGGIATLTSDVASAASLRLPPLSPDTAVRLRAVVKEYGTVGNPLDLTGQAFFEADLLRDALDVLAEDPGIDLIGYGRGVAVPVVEESAVARVFRDAVVRHPEVRFFLFTAATGPHVHAPESGDPLRELDGMPLLRGSEHALRAIAALARYAEFQRRRADPPTARRARADVATTARRLLARAPAAQLREDEAKELLALYGIPTTRDVLVGDADAAAATAERIGYPVALKIASRDLPHKTDVGGVLLGVRDAAGVRAGHDALRARVAAAVPGARLDGVLVSDSVEPGVELLLGLSQDPQLGLVITVGLGGIFAEAFHDTRALLPPLSEREARGALAGLRSAGLLLAGARGRGPSDVDAAVDAILRLSDLAADVGDLIAELDVNPLVVHARGAVAVDALVTLRAASQP